jgi:hypothetical protein
MAREGEAKREPNERRREERENGTNILDVGGCFIWISIGYKLSFSTEIRNFQVSLELQRIWKLNLFYSLFFLPQKNHFSHDKSFVFPVCSSFCEHSFVLRGESQQSPSPSPLKDFIEK